MIGVTLPFFQLQYPMVAVELLPPGTPCVRALIRGSWAMLRPNSTEVVDMY